MVGYARRPGDWSWLLLVVVLACTPGVPPAAPASAPGARPASPEALPGGAPAATAPAAVLAPVHVRIGSQFASTDVGHYLALERGYFQQEGLDVEFVSFANASEMIPALATERIEVGGMAVTRPRGTPWRVGCG